MLAGHSYSFFGKASIQVLCLFNFFILNFYYLFMAALGLHCGAQAVSSCSEWGLTHGLVALQHVESSWIRD